MIQMPLNDIKAKILEATEITAEALDSKIKDKMDQLAGLISEEGAAHIIANELGVKLFQVSGKLEIKNILAGMRDVEVLGKIARKFDVRQFDTGERSGQIGSFIMADTTGTMRVVLWNDQADLMKEFKEGDVIRLSSAYARENNGRMELHLNKTGTINVNPEGVTIDIKTPELVRKKLVDLKENDEHVEVLATIVQAFEPKFFPNKRQGENEPEFGYVMNLFLDDGSDNVRTVLWRERVQDLLSMKEDEIMKFKENPAEFEPIKSDLLGTIVKVTGRVKKNEMFERLELVANKLEMNPDPAEEMKSISTDKAEAKATLKVEAEEKKVEEKIKTLDAPKAEVTKVKSDDVDLDDLEGLPSLDEL